MFKLFSFSLKNLINSTKKVREKRLKSLDKDVRVWCNKIKKALYDEIERTGRTSHTILLNRCMYYPSFYSYAEKYAFIDFRNIRRFPQSCSTFLAMIVIQLEKEGFNCSGSFTDSVQQHKGEYIKISIPEEDIKHLE